MIRTVDRIDAQIAALEQEKLRLLTQPEDKYQNGDVVWFTKQFGGGGTTYTYAAIKVGNLWFLTQGDRFPFSPKSWDSLLDFVGGGEMWAATEWERVQ